MGLNFASRLGRPIRSMRRAAPALWAALAIVTSVGYLATTVDRGWVPHDTGQLGQTAERILAGQLQHRDFDEPYTGALGHLHALAFRQLGVSVHSMRYTLLAYAALFAAACYAVALRVSTPLVAAAVTLLCAALTLPVYAASMPSWYNLFFLLFAVAALLEFDRSGGRRWLFWAGCCIGCSLVIKITGLYLLATVLLYLAYRHLCHSRAGTGLGYTVLILVTCTAFSVLALVFGRGELPLRNLIHFSAGLIAVAACLAWQQWQRGRNGPVIDWQGLRAIAGQIATVMLGMALVIGLFLIPYLAEGAMTDLYRGLFVLPKLRLAHAALPPPALKWIACSLPLAGLMLVGMWRGAQRLNRWWILAAGAAVSVMFWQATGTVEGYHCLFQTLRSATPLLVAGAALVVIPRLATEKQPQVFLLVTALALGSLIQYPYAYGTYFFYAAPLVVLAFLYVVMNQPFAPRGLLAIGLGFLLVFAVWRLPQPDPRLMDGCYEPDFPTATLSLQRCGLEVYAEDARIYKELDRLIQAHSAPGSFIYAVPDCPEVYFLSSRRNPTRTFYELFEQTEPGDQAARRLDLLQQHRISLVVVNHHPSFSTPLSDDELAALGQCYPHTVQITGRRHPTLGPTVFFTVLWRD